MIPNTGHLCSCKSLLISWQHFSWKERILSSETSSCKPSVLASSEIIFKFIFFVEWFGPIRANIHFKTISSFFCNAVGRVPSPRHLRSFPKCPSLVWVIYPLWPISRRHRSYTFSVAVNKCKIRFHLRQMRLFGNRVFGNLVSGAIKQWKIVWRVHQMNERRIPEMMMMMLSLVRNLCPMYPRNYLLPSPQFRDNKFYSNLKIPPKRLDFESRIKVGANWVYFSC